MCILCVVCIHLKQVLLFLLVFELALLNYYPSDCVWSCWWVCFKTNPHFHKLINNVSKLLLYKLLYELLQRY